MKLFSFLAAGFDSGSGAHKEKKIAALPFWKFVFNTKINRRYLAIAIAGTIVQFVIFKMLYPFPDFISDSYCYIATNLFNMNVNLWPVGYSKFLLLIHAITPLDTFLVFIQYFLIELSILYFFFNILFLFSLRKNAITILFIFLFFNPLFLYLANCVLSDAIFCALSIVWMTKIFRMLRNPHPRDCIISAILIGILFTIRYTAVYYPIINAMSFLLSEQKVWAKLTGSLSPIALMIPFVVYTKNETKKITGTAEFSVFGGWQIANNALYMYDHINVPKSKLPPATVSLDNMVKEYFTTIPPQQRDVSTIEGTFFIKTQNAPLKKYLFSHYKSEGAIGQFHDWGMVSPIYKVYGAYLIEKYPIPFIKYYILPNIGNYFTPYLEKFSTYNLEQDKVWPLAQYWFQYNTLEIRSVSKTLQGRLFATYPSFFFSLNLIYIFTFVLMLANRWFSYMASFLRRAIILSAIFLIVNFCFSVFSTPVVLRYQVVPMIILAAFSLILLDYKPEEDVPGNV